MSTRPCFVYLLHSTFGSTYVGATMDLNHRLRQHNKEIKGGACATGAKVARGESWERHCYVSGFPDWKAALQFEWRWKQISRQIAIRNGKQQPIERRMDALRKLCALEQSTSKAVPYKDWTQPLYIHIESTGQILNQQCEVVDLADVSLDLPAVSLDPTGVSLDLPVVSLDPSGVSLDQQDIVECKEPDDTK